jgi:hypothetical protein
MRGSLMSDNFLRKLLNVYKKECFKECLTYSAGKLNDSLEKQKAPICGRSFLSAQIMKRLDVFHYIPSTLFFATQNLREDSYV